MPIEQHLAFIGGASAAASTNPVLSASFAAQRAGRLLLAVSITDLGTASTPTGWTSLVSQVFPGDDSRYQVFAKIADGTETSVAVTLTGWLTFHQSNLWVLSANAVAALSGFGSVLDQAAVVGTHPTLTATYTAPTVTPVGAPNVRLDIVAGSDSPSAGADDSDNPTAILIAAVPPAQFVGSAYIWAALIGDGTGDTYTDTLGGALAGSISLLMFLPLGGWQIDTIPIG